MISNIIDRRKRPYRWMRVNAVVENVWHDNSCDDADQAEPDERHSITYDEKASLSLHEAVTWAEGLRANVTLYLYDEGAGI